MNERLKRAPLRDVRDVWFRRGVGGRREFHHELSCGHRAVRLYRRIAKLPCLDCLAAAQRGA